MLRILFTVFLITSFSSTAQQEDIYEDTLEMLYKEFDEVPLIKNFDRKYRYALHRVRRVYPLALHAAIVIDSLEKEVANLDKKRKKKKAARQTHKELKKDFKYLLKSLYVSEGVILSKLIYRETGMTVQEIIDTYKSGTQAVLYTSLASLFDQELDATYDPDGEDFVLECVIRDIKSGKVDFDPDFDIMDRDEYKEDQAAYKESKKKNRKKARERKKAKRKQARKEKRNAN